MNFIDSDGIKRESTLNQKQYDLKMKEDTKEDNFKWLITIILAIFVFFIGVIYTYNLKVEKPEEFISSKCTLEDKRNCETIQDEGIGGKVFTYERCSCLIWEPYEKSVLLEGLKRGGIWMIFSIIPLLFISDYLYSNFQKKRK